MRALDLILDAGYELVLDERFDGDELDRSTWIPFYLPHWAGRKRSAPRYRLGAGGLELLIAADQNEWLPDLAPGLRVSSLQTALFAGPIGSTIGQHRTHESMRVVEEQQTEVLFTPQFGVIEMRASWAPHPDHMVALWMIGIEDEPHRSAEICVCEIFGREASDSETLVGMGVHPFGDPAITDDFDKVPLAIDVSELHDYAVAWDAKRVRFYVDGDQVKIVDQSPHYPMQLMLNIYGFGHSQAKWTAAPFVVRHIRAYQRAEAGTTLA